MSAQLKFVMPPPRKRGRPSKVSQHPELVPTIETFIKNNNPMAQERRRDDIMYTNGASLEELKSHVLKTVPSLDKISVSTIRRTMLPPDKKTNASERYTGKVPAKIPG